MYLVVTQGERAALPAVQCLPAVLSPHLNQTLLAQNSVEVNRAVHSRNAILAQQDHPRTHLSAERDT